MSSSQILSICFGNKDLLIIVNSWYRTSSFSMLTLLSRCHCLVVLFRDKATCNRWLTSIDKQTFWGVLKMLQFRLKESDHQIGCRDTEGFYSVHWWCSGLCDPVYDWWWYFHEFEAYLLWNAMHYSDFRDEERTLLVIREVEHYALMQGIENFEGTIYWPKKWVITLSWFLIAVIVVLKGMISPLNFLL